MRIFERWLKKKMRVDWPWAKKKKQILKEAAPLFHEKMSLDVSNRYGMYIFHNKGNSLMLRGDVYEPEVQQALIVLIGLDKIRKNNTVFADLGANIGLHTFYLKKQYSDLNVVAFDPSPSSWKYLDLTIKFNNIRDVRVEKIALSDQNGEFDLYNWGEESSADSLRNTERVHGIEPIIIKVPSRRLDDILDLPKITVIKMDCEGAELSILKGGKDTIAKNKPFILLEFHILNRKAFSISSQDIFNFLDEIEYKMYDLNFRYIDIKAFDSSQENNNEDYILLPNDILKIN